MKKIISVEGDGHCCHRLSLNFLPNSFLNHVKIAIKEFCQRALIRIVTMFHHKTTVTYVCNFQNYPQETPKQNETTK